MMELFFQAIVFFVLSLVCCHAQADDDELKNVFETPYHNAAEEWWNSTKRGNPNKYWIHILKEQSGLDDGDGERFDDMQSCVHTAVSEISDDNVVPQDKTAATAVIDTLIDSQNRTILVEIGNAITPSQVEKVKRLADCTRRYFPDRFEHRGFEESGGGNDCTYLNILLQILLPEVFENVVQITELAYETAGWGGEQLKLLPPKKSGLRTSEHLNYQKFSSLGGHTDSGSLFTTLFALSDPKRYQGGEFYILPRDEPDDRMYYFKPRQHSAVVFLAETHHGVTDLDGPREMFTNEFWVYDDAPWRGSSRAENANMHMFVDRVKETLDHTVDYYKGGDLADLWPHGEDVEDFDDYHNGFGYYEDDYEEDESEDEEGNGEDEEVNDELSKDEL
jgi:hypothetical protein